MPQETNLNVSPYFDDFDPAKNYYRVLFKPGLPVQARELTSLQAVLQDQVEQIGTHLFKEGSMSYLVKLTTIIHYLQLKLNQSILASLLKVMLMN